jgi:hypothetical protein
MQPSKQIMINKICDPASEGKNVPFAQNGNQRGCKKFTYTGHKYRLTNDYRIISIESGILSGQTQVYPVGIRMDQEVGIMNFPVSLYHLIKYIC